MEDCIHILSESRESPFDSMLVFQTKCHLIMDQITRYSAPDIGMSESPETASPPPYFVKTIVSQLQELRRNLPVELHNDPLTQQHIFAAELLAREASTRRTSLQGHVVDSVSNTHLTRLDDLHLMLSTIYKWVESRYSVPIPHWIGVPFSLCAQHSHCMILLLKLSTLDEKGWDTAEVRRRVDVLEKLETLAKGFEQVPKTFGLKNDCKNNEGLWFGAPFKLRMMKEGFRKEILSFDKAKFGVGGEGMGNENGAGIRVDDGRELFDKLKGGGMSECPMEDIDFTQFFEGELSYTDLFAEAWQM